MKLISYILIFMLIFSPLCAKEFLGRDHIIQAGDKLNNIAEIYYKDANAWPAILEATNDKAKFDSNYKNIKDPRHLILGNKLWLPRIEEVEHFLFEAEVRGDINTHDKDTVHWGYSGDSGPEMWGKLDNFYTPCSEGESQSPINIEKLSLQKTPDLEFYYLPSELTILNNGHTVQVNYDDGSYIKVNDTIYALVQYHFHTPSEHSFAGELSAMEMHLVHENANGDYAVVSVMINVGRTNANIAKVWKHFPKSIGHKEVYKEKVDANNLLPIQRQTYRYSGSFTTPPCTEGVSWFIMSSHIEVSLTQLKTFKNVINNNNRPIQKQNNRAIAVDNP